MDLLTVFFDFIKEPKKIEKIEVFRDYPIYAKNFEV